MKNKLITMFLLIIFLTTTILLLLNNNVFAEDTEEKNQNEEYKLDLDYLYIGSLYYVLPVEGIDCLNANGEHYGSSLYYLSFLKATEGGGYDIIEENINTDNLQVKSSNEKVLKITIEDKHVFVKAISEGKADILLTYTYQGKEYTNKTSWKVRPDPTPYFIVGENVAVLLDNSNIELNKKDTKNVEVYFSTLTTMLPDYPDGYNESNYFICDWKSLDESIVKIKNGSNSHIATLEAVSPGNTQVQCIVKTADNDENTITKNVNVTVIGKKDYEYELTSIEPIAVGPNKSVIEIGESVLTPVGLVEKTDGTIKEIDNSKLKIEISNPNLIKKESSGDIKAKAEGIITVKYSYTLDNKTYNYEEKRYIVSDKFSNGDIPLISNSIINLNSNNKTSSVYTEITRSGSYGVEYPDGYNIDNYYEYDWSIEDSKIAKIEKESDTKIKITALSNGNTKINLIIKTADEKENITKTINVSVSGFNNDNKTNEENNNDNKKENKNEDKTTSPEKIPNAGSPFGIKSAILVLLLIGIISFIKYKK